MNNYDDYREVITDMQQTILDQAKTIKALRKGLNGEMLFRWFCYEVDDFEEYFDNNSIWKELEGYEDMLYRLVAYLDEFDADTLIDDYIIANK